MAPPSGTLSPTLSGLTFFWVHTDCLAERPCTLSLFMALPSLLHRWRSPLLSFSHSIPTTNGHTRSESQIFPQLNPSFSSLSETVTFNQSPFMSLCKASVYSLGNSLTYPLPGISDMRRSFAFPQSQGHPDAYWPSNSNVSAFVKPFQLFN